jgi:hypothetical protein
MPTESVSSVERLAVVLDRLRRHLTDARDGATTARDDLAVDLQLLVGEGDGYGTLQRTYDQLQLPTPTVTGWAPDALPRTLNPDDANNRLVPLTLALRASCPSSHSDVRQVPVSTVLKQECVRFSVPGFQPAESWTWGQIIKKVRNKYGGHVDPSPPRWLDELRYYPAADSDAITLLLWSAGDTLLRSVTAHLRQLGVDIQPFTPPGRYLGGIDLTVIYVLQDSDPLDVRAELECEQWQAGFRRAIVGARFGNRPFIFGLEADGGLSISLGDENSSLRDFVKRFRISPP